MTNRITLAVLAAIIILGIAAPFLVQAQAPTPVNVPTLGPVQILSNDIPVNILTPQNSSYYSNQVQLKYTISATGLFGQFGNVGYQIDNGVINSTTSYGTSVVTATNVPAPGDFYKTTTAYGTITLPDLSNGTHKVTVYYGWQYLGIPENPNLERYMVHGYTTTVFNVGSPIETLSTTHSPTPSSSFAVKTTPIINSSPTIPEVSSIAIILLVSITLTGVLLYKRRNAYARNLD
jgi:hypothetical protein